MKGRLLILSFLLTLSLFMINSASGLAVDYRPKLSGNFELGDRLYTDPIEEEVEELIDQYWYRRCWLKYTQKLSSKDYYYLKGQYYKKEYEEKISYDNLGLDLWGNYTYHLTDKLRNKWLLNLRDKDYFNNSSSSYCLARVKYQLDYRYNVQHNYTICLQRQWKDYHHDQSKDNTCDRLSLNWEYKVNDDFKLNTNLQFDRELYQNSTVCSNKYGKKIAIGFKYDL